jgi:hypothetical protein
LPVAARQKGAPKVALFPLPQLRQSALRASCFNPCRWAQFFFEPRPF